MKSSLKTTINKFLAVATAEEKARAMCLLNCWETPKALKIGHKLSEEEIREVWGWIGIPYSAWIKEWQKEIDKPREERSWGEVENENQE